MLAHAGMRHDQRATARSRMKTRGSSRSGGLTRQVTNSLPSPRGSLRDQFKVRRAVLPSRQIRGKEDADFRVLER